MEKMTRTTVEDCKCSNARITAFWMIYILTAVCATCRLWYASDGDLPRAICETACVEVFGLLVFMLSYRSQNDWLEDLENKFLKGHKVTNTQPLLIIILLTLFIGGLSYWLFPYLNISMGFGERLLLGVSALFAVMLADRDDADTKMGSFITETILAILLVLTYEWIFSGSTYALAIIFLFTMRNMIHFRPFFNPEWMPRCFVAAGSAYLVASIYNYFQDPIGFSARMEAYLNNCANTISMSQWYQCAQGSTASLIFYVVIVIAHLIAVCILTIYALRVPRPKHSGAIRYLAAIDLWFMCILGVSFNTHRLPYATFPDLLTSPISCAVAAVLANAVLQTKAEKIKNEKSLL